jgi:hypothetical protein
LELPDLRLRVSIYHATRRVPGPWQRTGKVKEDTKGHDAQALGRGKVSVSGADVFVLARLLVEHLDVGRDISVSPFLGVFVEHLIRDLADVELVIAFVHAILARNQTATIVVTNEAPLTNGQQVILNLVEDGHRVAAVHLGGIREASAVVQVAGINKEQVNSHVASRLPHSAGKGDEITPVGAVVLLLQVTLEPSVGVGLRLPRSIGLLCVTTFSNSPCAGN